MITINQAIIVEGKYDKIKLEGIIDGTIITTDGFRIYKDKEKLALIKAFAEKTGVIILTDSDGAGFQIRNHLKSCIGGKGSIINVYIPDIFGKEKRKREPSSEGKLGVEGVSREILLDAFEKAGIFTEPSGKLNPSITRQMLFEDGFIGAENSAVKREALCRSLSLPVHLSTASLLEILNRLYSEESYKKIIGTL